MNKYYAVKRGLTPGIYRTWDECKVQVIGYPGAKFKSFHTEYEAQEYLSGVPTINQPMADASVHKELERNADGDAVIAYVDGSFVEKDYFTCGVVILDHERKIYISKKFHDSGYALMRNVAGEIAGATEAMRYCAERSIPKLVIYHDYEGVGKWCTGEWMARKPETRAYRDFYERVSANCDIRFVKVKGHSGVEYNELADQLANAAHELECAERLVL